MNQQIKKNAISFDIDFENIKQGTITTKERNKEKTPNKTEVIPNVEDPNEANKEQVLYQCQNCGRKFKREAYAKHVPICARVFQNKKEPENPKNSEKPPTRQKANKGMNNKPKWENQSNELRAIIQSKRAEKNNDKKNEIKIEIEEPKKHNDINNNMSTSPMNRPLFSRDSKGFLQCELCNKKFTKMNFESHLNDCKNKHKDKKNGGMMRGNMGGSLINNNLKNNANNVQMSRKPIMPEVTYGRNKPKFSLKFGK